MALSENVAGEVAAEEAVSATGGVIAAVKVAAESAENIKASGPISTVVIVIAMQTEALPLVNKFQLLEDADSPFPKCVPWVRYHGTYKGLNINIIWPGKDSILGVDCVGTVSVSLVTYASIQALRPDLIINAGTAGGFKAKGASITDVYLASDVAFHDRRIPIPGVDDADKRRRIVELVAHFARLTVGWWLENSSLVEVFDQYGVGSQKAFSTPNLSRELNLKVGKLSTGDSLDMSPHDEASIIANDAVVKDMEGAAVAYVANLFSVPAIFLKAVTDIIDGDKPTAEEFLENLVAVTAALDQAVSRVVDFLPGKCLSEL